MVRALSRSPSERVIAQSPARAVTPDVRGIYHRLLMRIPSAGYDCYSDTATIQSMPISGSVGWARRFRAQER